MAAVDPIAVMSQYQPMQRSTLAAGIESIMGLVYQYNKDALMDYYGGMTPAQRRSELARINARKDSLSIKRSFVDLNEAKILDEIAKRDRDAGVHQRAGARTSSKEASKAEKKRNKLKEANNEALEDLYGADTINKVGVAIHKAASVQGAVWDVANDQQLRTKIRAKNISEQQVRDGVISYFQTTAHQDKIEEDAQLLLPVDRDPTMQGPEGRRVGTNRSYADEYIGMYDLMKAGAKRYDGKTVQAHLGATHDSEIDQGYEGQTTAGGMPGRKSRAQIEAEVRKERAGATLEAQRMEAEKQRQIQAGGEPRTSMSRREMEEALKRETGVTNPLLQAYIRPADKGMPTLREPREPGASSPLPGDSGGDVDFDIMDMVAKRKAAKVDEYGVEIDPYTGFGSDFDISDYTDPIINLGEKALDPMAAFGFDVAYKVAKKTNPWLKEHEYQKQLEEEAIKKGEDEDLGITVEGADTEQTVMDPKLTDPGASVTADKTDEDIMRQLADREKEMEIQRNLLKQRGRAMEGKEAEVQRKFDEDRVAALVDEAFLEPTGEPVPEVEATQPESEPTVEVGTLLTNVAGQKHGYVVTEIDAASGQPIEVKWVTGKGTVLKPKYREGSQNFTDALATLERMKNQGRLK